MSDVEKWQLLGFMFCVMSAVVIYAAVMACVRGNEFWEVIEHDED